ncbi:MAG: hypothetical protein ACRDJI_03125 [Actinomycetota bacterium]
MRNGRPLVRVIVVVALAAVLPPATSRAQEECDHALVMEPGPICAELQPPLTIYEVVDAKMLEEEFGDETEFDVYWEKTPGCGRWYPGVNGVTFDGEPLQKDKFFATWSHNNSPHPDGCSHDAPDHPGTIVAEVWEKQTPGFPFFLPIAGRTTRCTYDRGSASGGGPVCAPPEPNPKCLTDTTTVAVRTGGAEVDISAQDSQLTVNFPKGEASSCTAPITSTTSVTVLGNEDVNDHVTVDAALLANVSVGINLGSGDDDTVTVEGTSGIDAATLSGFLPTSEFVSGGIVLDFFDDGQEDLGTTTVEHIGLNLGDGNDKITVNIENLYPLVGATGYKTTFDGGLGRDLTVLQGDAAYGYSEYFGMAPGQTPTAQVNLNGDQDDIVDVSAVAFEKWTVTGTDDRDVISGAGGHGTGDPFTFPLKLFGEAGNDKLTGGTKADVIDGGRGKKDVCVGGKGRDSALGCETVKSIP